MSLLPAVNLRLRIGAGAPTPAPPDLLEALQSVDVNHGDQGRSGFQLTFSAARAGPADAIDYALLRNPLLKPFTRVIVSVSIGPLPSVLMDGMITHEQLAPPAAPGAPPTLVVTGEDMGVMMDLEERSALKPAQGDQTIAQMIGATYGKFGVVPDVTPPPNAKVPNTTEQIPSQHASDWDYLTELARRHSFVFYLEPGPVEGMSTAYWGPPKRSGEEQRGLTVDMGGETNVNSLRVRMDALQPTAAAGQVQDAQTNQPGPVQAQPTAQPPLAAQPVSQLAGPNLRKFQVRQSGLRRDEAIARAQAQVNLSTDAVAADGDLDGAIYGQVLKPWRPVGVRGVGYSYDGLYYVKRVSHHLERGQYRQQFSLAREGKGSTIQAVRVA